MSTQNKNSRRESLRLFVNGMKLHLLGQKTVVIDNVTYQIADIITQTEADIAASDAADKGHTDWIALVEKERASHEAIDPILSGVEKIVRVQFGNSEGAVSILGDFGLAAHRKPVLSPEAKVARAKKAKATRTLLHTAGPKQKADIKKQASQAAAPAEGTPGNATPPPATSGATTPATPTKQ